jgi:hypothetical protein
MVFRSHHGEGLGRRPSTLDQVKAVSDNVIIFTGGWDALAYLQAVYTGQRNAPETPNFAPEGS